MNSRRSSNVGCFFSDKSLTLRAVAVFAGKALSGAVASQNAVMAAIQEINNYAHGHPDKQSEPVGRGKREHQNEAKQYAQEGNYRHERTTERAVGLRIYISHYEDGGADDDKGKKGADIDQLGEDAEGDKRGHRADRDTRKNG